MFELVCSIIMLASASTALVYAIKGIKLSRECEDIEDKLINTLG